MQAKINLRRRTLANVALALLVLATAPLTESARQIAQSDDSALWKQVRPGGTWHDIRFDSHRQVWLEEGPSRTLLLTLPHPEEDFQTIGISPPDPTGNFVFVIAEGDEEQPGWLVDKKARRATRLPLPDGVADFAAWSPDSRRVVIHTTLYEGADQLWVVDVGAAAGAGLGVREVHRGRLEEGSKSCCGLDSWAGSKSEQGRVDEDSIHWTGAQTFSFRLWTRCDPEASAKCRGARELGSYLVTVDAETGKVTDRRLGAQNR